jgi:hypothetical protein
MSGMDLPGRRTLLLDLQAVLVGEPSGKVTKNDGKLRSKRCYFQYRGGI